MDNLKELTAEEHRNAERQGFVKKIFKGELTDDEYATYLYNQHKIYDILEMTAMMHGLFNDTPQLRRAPLILQDFDELWTHKDRAPTECPVVKKYLKHMFDIKEDREKVMAHVYVRHMGDLSGGQMIAKRVPGEGRMYKFEADHNELKEKIRKKLNDNMAAEAKVCFEFATQLFKELEEGIE